MNGGNDKTKQFERILFNILTRVDIRKDAGETGSETSRPTMLLCPVDSFSLKSPLKVRDNIVRTMKISNPSGIKPCEF